MRICPKCHLEYHDDDRTDCLVDGTHLEEAADPRVGKLIAGRYLVEGVIGEGGMATVYRARSTLVNEPVAVKILHSHLASDPKLRERFRREAKSAAALAHENVVEIKDFGDTADGSAYLVMELLEGEPLRAAVKRGPMTISLVVNVAAQIARGVARAHDLGVVHRDLKPENVFLCPLPGGGVRAKIVDFGIARTRDESHLTMRGAVIGTPQYLAPERVRGTETTPSCDLYALGVMIYEMITGELPFRADDVPGYILHHLETPAPSPRKLAPACPAALAELVLHLMAKDPAERPVDAHQVVRALDAIGASLGAEAMTEEIPLPLVTHAKPAQLLAPLTLERWEKRALVFDQMLRRAYPDGNAPDTLRGAVDEVRGAVRRLELLRRQRIARQRVLDGLANEARAERERLGHAVHELGVDLSNAREAALRLRAQLEAEETGVRELEAQIDVLRSKLESAETTAESQRAEAERALADSGVEIEELQRALGAAARTVVSALGSHPEARALLAEVEQG